MRHGLQLQPTILIGLLFCLGLTVSAVAGAEEAPTTQAPASVGWRLGRSDVARYERVTVTEKAGVERRKAARIVMIEGNQLCSAERAAAGRAGEGQYDPPAPVYSDLPQVLAFQLVQPGQQQTKVKRTWIPRGVTTLRIQGSVRITRVLAGETFLEGTYTFKSRGKAEQDDRWALSGGRAATRIIWDPTQGVVKSVRLEMSYKRKDLQAKGRGAKKSVQRVYAYDLKAVRRMRPPDFASSVKEAIEHGVAHLRTLQQEDGSFKPYKEWRIGSTALAVLALVSCGVPREDKQVERALGWIFRQEPEKTYDRAACLMAIDRAYTPAEELEAIRRGNLVKTPIRTLPPKRMAWVQRTAEDLMQSAPSPGSWGYPTAGNIRMRTDLSNTQYAVLGMRAAAHLGYKPVDGMGREDVDAWANLWIGVLRYCRGLQGRKGPKGSVSLVRHGQAIPDEHQAHELYRVSVPKVAGFRYATVAGHDHMSASMTCAGITCLLVARHELLRIDCERLSPKRAEELEDMLNGAWAWLDENWALDRHAGHPAGRWYYYSLYCLERAGILGNIKRVGGKDWHFEGCEQLLARQLENGSWNHSVLPTRGTGASGPGGGAEGIWSSSRKNETPPTCFALLFLQRGTAPLSGEITCK